MLSCRLSEGAELRQLEPFNAEEFTAHVERGRDHFAPWLPFAALVTGPDTARRLLQTYADSQARDGGRIYGIWLDGKLAGGVLFRIFDTGSGTCELGVWLEPHAQGRGLVTRAAGHMIDWALRVRGMTRVEWRVHPDNAPSIATAVRLGMSRDGVLRQAAAHNGTHHDLEVWSLLANEWEPAQGS